MKPIERTTVEYVCGDCKKSYGSRDRAETCCACIECGGPTTPEDRIANKRGYDLRCSWCEVRRDVKRQQDSVRRQEESIKDSERRLEAMKRELEREQSILAVCLARRDALPPKPRQPKEPKEKGTTP